MKTEERAIRARPVLVRRPPVQELRAGPHPMHPLVGSQRVSENEKADLKVRSGWQVELELFMQR